MKVWDIFSIDSINGSPEKITYWGKYIAILVIIDKPLTICQVPARWQDIFSTSNLIGFQLLSLYLKLCKEIYLNQHAHPWWSYNTTWKALLIVKIRLKEFILNARKTQNFLHTHNFIKPSHKTNPIITWYKVV